MALETNVPLSELALGDVVRLDCEAYGDATVKQIHPNGDVTVFRPYVQTADFSYTGGVICYIGTEEVTLHGAPVTRVRKGQPLK